ncbi:MAG: ATP synthase F1 subunit gamma [Coriobacteriia bacterium]|nr:ATP synthase F1 subunit gamma [Coriobacteriia bacterium]
MPNLRDIKRRISSVQSTRQITRTMEMVATAKIKKAQERIESARPYALSMMEVLGNVARYVQGATHPLLEEHAERRRIAIITLTSDRGLCGAFNANILRLTEGLVKQAAQDGAEAEIIAVGKKATSYLKYRGVTPVAEYRDISDKPTFAHARAIAAHVIPAYAEGRLDAAYVVFNRFKNVAEQKAEVHQLLPIERRVVQEEETPGPKPEYLFEPSPAAVLEKLLPMYVETLIYRALLESAASEQGARRVAMKSATDNAGEIITTLTRSYNRARQASITNEIAEIVGGAAALEES